MKVAKQVMVPQSIQCNSNSVDAILPKLSVYFDNCARLCQQKLLQILQQRKKIQETAIASRTNMSNFQQNECDLQGLLVIDADLCLVKLSRKVTAI